VELRTFRTAHRLAVALIASAVLATAAAATAAAPVSINLAVTKKTITVSGFANTTLDRPYLYYGSKKCTSFTTYYNAYVVPVLSSFAIGKAGHYSFAVDIAQLFALPGAQGGKYMHYVCAYLEDTRSRPNTPPDTFATVATAMHTLP
jgi:hypothetical protein